jgi:hypothetical protein
MYLAVPLQRSSAEAFEGEVDTAEGTINEGLWRTADDYAAQLPINRTSKIVRSPYERSTHRLES